MEYNIYSLPNGIRLIHKPVSSLIAHVGLFINAGSRDETAKEHGLAHYIEHAIFKGTKKRKSYHIISRLEDVGGELNAYTTKEETCIHASFLLDDTERAIELISDIAFNSTFPEKEIEKEKDVIIDEINSYKDNPSEQIFDDFESMLFSADPLGRCILGTPDTVRSFTRNDICNFIKKHYNTNQIVLCYVGNIDSKKLVRYFIKYFEGIEKSFKSTDRPAVLLNSTTNKIEIKNTFQAHCIIGTTAYSFKDDKRIALHLLSNYLGGPGMNSKLNMSLRERHGCTYNIESSYTPYIDAGTFMIYFGTDKENLDKCLSLTFKELDLLKKNKLGEIQLSKAKKQLMGQLAIASEQTPLWPHSVQSLHF